MEKDSLADRIRSRLCYEIKGSLLLTQPIQKAHNLQALQIGQYQNKLTSLSVQKLKVKLGKKPRWSKVAASHQQKNSNQSFIYLFYFFECPPNMAWSPRVSVPALDWTFVGTNQRLLSRNGIPSGASQTSRHWNSILGWCCSGSKCFCSLDPFYTCCTICFGH